RASRGQNGRCGVWQGWLWGGGGPLDGIGLEPAASHGAFSPRGEASGASARNPVCCRLRAAWLEQYAMKEPPGRIRTTDQEQLPPTPAHERLLDAVLWHCRTLYPTALEQRLTAWQRRRVSLARDAQAAELKALRAQFPESLQPSIPPSPGLAG